MEVFQTKYDLLNEAYNDDRIKKGTLILFQFLVNASDDKGCFPAVETIAEALSCCKRTVQNNMRKLERFGYIIRKERWYNHQQLSNSYSFNLGVREEKKIIWADGLNNSICGMFDEATPLKSGFYKSQVISWIFSLELSTKEKLLMVYCVNRANQKGIMYNSAYGFCEALGISERTLHIILRNLRIRELLRIRSCILNGRKCYVLQITGRIINCMDDENTNDNTNDNTTSLKDNEIDCKRQLVNMSQNKYIDHKLNKADQGVNVVHVTQKFSNHRCMEDILYGVLHIVMRKLRKILRI